MLGLASVLPAFEWPMRLCLPATPARRQRLPPVHAPVAAPFPPVPWSAVHEQNISPDLSGNRGYPYIRN